MGLGGGGAPEQFKLNYLAHRVFAMETNEEGDLQRWGGIHQRS